MSYSTWSVALAVTLCLGGTVDAQTRLRIAAVDNPDILLLRDLVTPAIQRELAVVLDWTLYPEDVLRKQTALDFRTARDNYDVVMIGAYDTPISAAQGWLTPWPEARPPADYLPTVVDALSYQGRAYALPFYGESSMTYYRADWFASAGLTMPQKPTWEQIEQFAAALHRPQAQRYGVCLRGEAGWGINMALFNTMGNAHGARWFDEAWEPQLNSPEWQAALSQYVRLMRNYGPPNPETLGFNRILSLFRDGQCAIWVDATVAASVMHNTVPGLDYAEAPHAVTEHGKQWLWSWALTVPATSRQQEAAWRFVRWATSSDYHALVERSRSIDRVPPGTLHSLYERADYHAVAPFAQATFAALQRADPTRPTLEPVPYEGIQYVGIAEFSFIAEQFGKKVLAAVHGNITEAQALEDVQLLAEAFMAIQRRNR